MADEEEDAKDQSTDGDGESDGDEDEEGGTGGKKGLILIIVGVLLLLGGGGAAYFFLMGGEEDPEAATEEQAGDSDEEAEEGDGEDGEGAAGTGPVFYDMPEFLVNLSTPNQKPSFLKMKVTLELEKEEDILLVESYMPRITDSLNTYLRELRASDLAGSAGLYRLREELIMRINQFTAPTKVRNVLFKDIVVQ